MRFKSCMVLLPLLALLGACNQEALTLAETRQALDEVAGANQALNVASGTVEITTHFTIGQALADAAEELRTFILSQLPCAEVVRDGAKLTITYGAHAGNCTYLGQTYTGSHSVEVKSTTSGDLRVHHEWDQVSNSKFSVTGTADVTWSAAEGSRQVVHELHWTKLPGGFEVVGSGDRTQTALPAGIIEGIAESGTRQWTSEAGKWTLAISGMEIRWSDPVPQAGTYVLSTPFNGKVLTMSFARVDQDTIAVTVTTGRITFHFNVNKAGTVTNG